MRILIDQPAVALLLQMQPRPARADHTPYACYAANAPYQTTLELWNNQSLPALVNTTVEAQSTYCFGEAGYVLAGNEGRLHRYIEVFGPVSGPSDITLSQLVLTGPRAETDGAAVRSSLGVANLAQSTAQRQMGGRI
jgi:hypothetical protein